MMGMYERKGSTHHHQHPIYLLSPPLTVFVFSFVFRRHQPRHHHTPPRSTMMTITRYVERGARGNEFLDGGKERLVSSIIVVRKSYYYSRHFVSILFLMTSSVFSCFTVSADDIETRCNIVFSLLLTVVAFNYSTSDSIPNVPYATVLEDFINTCFLTVLAVGVAAFGFAWALRNYPNVYKENVESVVGGGMFLAWLIGNYSYWNGIFLSKELIKKTIEEDEQIGWLKFKERKQGAGRSLSAVPRMGLFANLQFSLSKVFPTRSSRGGGGGGWCGTKGGRSSGGTSGSGSGSRGGAERAQPNTRTSASSLRPDMISFAQESTANRKASMELTLAKKAGAAKSVSLD